MSEVSNTKSPYTSCGCDASFIIFEDLCQHNTSFSFKWLLIFSSKKIFSMSIAGILKTLHRDCSGNRCWRKNLQGEHKLIVKKTGQLAIMCEVHDNIGHKQFFTTQAALLQHFWWPHMQKDIAWYIQTCDICQRYQMQKVLIPPVVAMPASLFSKIYVNTMHLPVSGGFQYLVQERCSLCQ